MQKMNKILTVKIVPDLEISRMNYVRVSGSDYPNDCYILIDNRYVFTTQICTKIKSGTIGLTYSQRKWGLWSTNQNVIVSFFSNTPTNNNFNIGYLGVINLEIKLFNNFNNNNYNISKNNNHQYNYNKLKKKFIKKFQSQIIQPTQILLFEYKKIIFELIVQSTLVLNLETVNIGDASLSSCLRNKGIVVNTTIINFIQYDNKVISLEKSQNRKMKQSIIRSDFKFNNKKGLLDIYLTNTIRIALASRFFPNNIIEKMDLRHTKGILIFGISKFSKCLLSKKIGKKLNTKEPKIYNSSKVLSQYFDSNGEFLTDIFKDAELEFERKGDKSSLHIIVFDDLDSILTNNKIKYQISKIFIRELLNKVENDFILNNILIIGMLQDRKLAYPDLVKPGRFDVQIEHEKCNLLC